jgi:N-acetylmuramoyl-L-alanine amidase
MDEKRSITKGDCIVQDFEDGRHFYDPLTGEEILDFFEPLENEEGEAVCPCHKKWACSLYVNAGKICPNYSQEGCQCDFNKEEEGEEKLQEDDKSEPKDQDEEGGEELEPEGSPGEDGLQDSAKGVDGSPSSAGNVTTDAIAGEAGEVGAVGEAGGLAEAGGTAIAAGGAEGGGGFIAFLIANPEIAIAVLVILVVLVIFLVVAIAIGTQKPEAYGETASSISTICLDPGHSPHPSNGKTGEKGEMELNWQTANEVKALLETDGYNVVMTRNDINEEVDNSERPKICQNAGAPFLFAIHHNDAPGKKGPFMIIPKSSRKNIYTASKSYAETIQTTIAQSLGIEGKTSGSQPVDGGLCVEGSSCTSDNLEIVGSGESIGEPVMYIEIMALDSQGRTWITNPTNRIKMNRAIADGIEKAAPKGGNLGQKIAQTALDYTKNLEQFRKDRPVGGKSNDPTDCGGFVTTVIWKTGLDPEFVKWSTSHLASEYADYFRSHPEKYKIISEDLNDTSQLQPGDILVNYKYNSHTAIYVGELGTSTGGTNKAEASLHGHEPDNQHSWYSKLHFAARMIK